MKKTAKKVKTQGTKADAGALSDTRLMPTPQHLDRGVGSEFANSVKSAIETSKSVKGSEASFLGVDKKIIDPKQFAHSLVSDKDPK